MSQTNETQPELAAAPVNEHAEGMTEPAGPSAAPPSSSGATPDAALVLLEQLRGASRLNDPQSGLEAHLAGIVRREAVDVLNTLDSDRAGPMAPEGTATPSSERPTLSLTQSERVAVDLVRALMRPTSGVDPQNLRESIQKHYDDRTVRDLVALVIDVQLEHMAAVVSDPGPGSRDQAPPARQTVDRSPVYEQPIEAALVCPQCGHALSRFMEPTVSRANRAAGRVADAMGSWRFIVGLCAVTVGYVVVALAMRPSNTDTAIVLNYLGIAMTTLVGVQTPLILLTQRRDAARDRAREQEALRVATRAERDLHAIRAALDGQHGRGDA